MTTFAQLLTEYIQRSGITDAELARSIGVRRQTIFRWKEGIVTRPRHRDDVLRCARRLRLTAQEQDRLLMAAGFATEASRQMSQPGSAPDSPIDPSAGHPMAQAERPLPEPQSGPYEVKAEASKAPQSRFGRHPLLMAALFLLMVAGALAGLRGLAGLLRPVSTPTPQSATVTVAVSMTATPAPTPTPISISAAPGETLILVARFANYTQNLSFHAAGRIREALEEEIGAAQLDATAVTIWPEPIEDRREAGALMATTGAALLIWGEYDSGRVRVNFESSAAERNEWERTTPSTEELIALINVEMKDQVRSIALLSLGRLYRAGNDRANAIAVFRRGLEADDLEADTIVTLRFYLATVLQRGAPPEQEEAIALYSEILAERPDLTNAWYNRGKTFLNRFYAQPGERSYLDDAIEDWSAVIRRRPDHALSYLNRAVAYYERNDPGDEERALNDLEEVLALEPQNEKARFNRGLVKIRQGEDVAWDADFIALLATNPQHASAENALCWGYALDARAEESLRHCDRAQALGVDIAARDGRAMALAQLGRYDEAIAELEVYLEWLQQQPPDAYLFQHGPEVEAWLAALAAGEMPFTPEVLDALR